MGKRRKNYFRYTGKINPSHVFLIELDFDANIIFFVYKWLICIPLHV